MKTFSQYLSEGPQHQKSDKDKMEKQPIELIDIDPREEGQFGPDPVRKDKTKIASYEEGDDEVAYLSHNKGTVKESAGKGYKVGWMLDAIKEKNPEIAKKLKAKEDEKRLLNKYAGKTVKEDAEQLDEYEKYTDENGVTWNDEGESDHGHTNWGRGPMSKYGRRSGGVQKRVGDVFTGKDGRKWVRTANGVKPHTVKEEVEQIDEISKETAGRYIDAARKEGEKDIPNYLSATGKERERLSKKLDKRSAGINRAMSKLREDAEQIEEISADTLQKYRVKAKAQSNADYQKVRDYTFSPEKGEPGKGKEMFNLLKKVEKRIEGVDKASARLGKTRFDEEAQIDEALQGSLSKSDYTSGARGKLADTNCKTCHGRKTVYKLDGKVYADNKSGSTKMKCSACDGTGNLKEEVVEEGLANLVKRTFKSVVDRIPPAHVLDPRRGEIPPATGQVSKQNVHHVAGDRSKAGFNKADLAKKYGTKNIVSEPVSKDVTITKKKGGGLTGTLMADMSNDDAALNEARFDHREAGSHGVIHSDSARHYKVGEHRDFYDHGTGDKKYGKVTRNDGKNIHIQHDGKVKKFTVGTNYPGLHDKKLDESADHEELKDLKSRGMKLTAQEMRRKFELERKLKGPKTDQEKEHERWERGYTRNRN